MRFPSVISFLIFISLLILSFEGICQEKLRTIKTINGEDSLKFVSVPKISYEQRIDSIIYYAEKYLGTRYRAGGRSREGFDCSGFTSYVFEKFGIDIPHSATDQALKGIPLDRTQIKRGDLVFFKGRNKKNSRVGHVGLVVEKNDSIIRFIHASSRKGITYDVTTSDYYKIRFVGAKRVLSENAFDSLWVNHKFPDPIFNDSIDLKIKKPIIVDLEQKQNNQSFDKQSSKYYTVRNGDNLYAIAKRNHTTTDKIMKLNNLKSDKINPGKKLIVSVNKTIKPQNAIPKTTALIKKDSIGSKDEVAKVITTEQKPQPKAEAEIISNKYTVRKGDNIYAIAKKNHTTEAKIKELNNLESDKIIPGQKLIVK